MYIPKQARVIRCKRFNIKIDVSLARHARSCRFHSADVEFEAICELQFPISRGRSRRRSALRYQSRDAEEIQNPSGGNERADEKG